MDSLARGTGATPLLDRAIDGELLFGDDDDKSYCSRDEVISR